MTEPADDIIGEIGRLLDQVQPSPEFAARVRRRLDAHARWAWLRIDWRNILATGVVVGLATSLLVMVRVRPTTIPERNAAHPRAAAAAPLSEARPAIGPARRPESGTRLASLVAAGLVAARTTDSLAPTVSRMDGHDVIVPVDERLALMRLLSRVRAGYGTVPASIVPAYDIDGLLLPPPPVVITPLPELAPVEPGTGQAQISKFIPRDNR